MNSFDYIRPATVAEAIAAAAEPGSAFLAAGTNLLDMMKIGALRPDRLVDLTHLPGLSEVEWLSDGGVRIGARRAPPLGRCTGHCGSRGLLAKLRAYGRPERGRGAPAARAACAAERAWARTIST